MAAQGLAEHGAPSTAGRGAQVGLRARCTAAPAAGSVGHALEAVARKGRAFAAESAAARHAPVQALLAEGYAGKDDSVDRFVKLWREQRVRRSAQVFIPLVFAPGEAYQFDWSYETVELDGEPVTVKAAQFRLWHSRHYFVRAYVREAQEQVFDAHNRQFAFFGGVTWRGIDDNLKIASMRCCSSG